MDELPLFAYMIAAALACLAVTAVLVKFMWKVPAFDEALIISGFGTMRSDYGLGFQIVTNGGKLVIPGLQVVGRLSLAEHRVDFSFDCHTINGVPVGLHGALLFKVGDDQLSIGNAARRYLDGQHDIDADVRSVLEGHLRNLVGKMTLAEIVRDREALTGTTREAMGIEMEKLGLIVDSLQFHDLDDPTQALDDLDGIR